MICTRRLVVPIHSRNLGRRLQTLGPLRMPDPLPTPGAHSLCCEYFGIITIIFTVYHYLHSLLLLLLSIIALLLLSKSTVFVDLFYCIYCGLVEIPKPLHVTACCWRLDQLRQTSSHFYRHVWC